MLSGRSKVCWTASPAAIGATLSTYSATRSGNKPIAITEGEHEREHRRDGPSRVP